MKIPLSNARPAENRPVGTPYSNVDARVGSLGEGIADVGQGVGRAAEGAYRDYLQEEQREIRNRQEIRRIRSAAAEKARVVRATEAETEAQRRITRNMYGDATGGGVKLEPSQGGFKLKDSDPGFLSLRGHGALSGSVGLKQQFEKDREEIAKSLPDDETKELFKLRSQSLYLGAERQAEAHVAQEQERLEVETSKNRREAALSAAAADPLNEDAARAHRISVEGPTRALQRSKEAGDADMREYDGRVADARISGALSLGKYDAAELLLEQNKAALPPAKLEAHRKDIALRKADLEAETLAAQAIIGATGEEGRVDPAIAAAAIDALPDGVGKDKARTRMEHRLAVSEKQWKARVESHFSSAFTSLLETNDLSQVAPGDRAWLLNNAPEEWAKLVDRERRYLEHLRQANVREQRAAAETREQRETMVRFRSDLTQHPEKYAAPDYGVEQFNTEWGNDLHPTAYRVAGKVFADAKKEKGTSAAEFTRYVADEVGANPVLLRNKAKRELFEALMGDARRAYKEAHNGQEPKLEDLDKLKATVWTSRKTWFGLSEETVLKDRGGPAPAKATPPPKRGTPKPEGWRQPGIYRRPDGTRYRVMSDGITEGKP